MATGPNVLSVPVDQSLVGVSGALAAFLENGGWVAWGVVPTDRPIPTSSYRPWRDLNNLWQALARGGCDLDRLRSQALLTPACGLFAHAESVTDRVFHLVREVSERLTGCGGSAPILSIGA